MEEIYNVNNDTQGYYYYKNMLLEKIIDMFLWHELPENIPTQFINESLFIRGNVAIAEERGIISAVKGGYSGAPDMYGYSTEYTYAYPTYQEKYTKTIGKDIVVCDNTRLRKSLNEFLSRYATLLSKVDTSLDIGIVNTRLIPIISATTKNAVEQINAVIEDMKNGKYRSVADFGEFGEIRSTLLNKNNTGALSDMEHLVNVRDAIYSQFCLEVGIPMMKYEKRAQLISEETNGVQMLSQINIGDMLQCRKEFCEKVNAMFGLNMSVSLNPLWESSDKKEENDEQKGGVNDEND